jgi:hypothetical protein
MEVAAFLKEAAKYFSARDTGGEDRAHWANVYNAENCLRAAVTFTSAQAEIERLTKELDEAKRLALKHHSRAVEYEAAAYGWKSRADAAEKERDALREALDSARNLPITDTELVRMNNSAVGTDEVRISSRIVLLLVGLAMSTRSALQPQEPHDAP